MVVRTTTALARLLDVLSLTGGDRRIQTVFTHDPACPAVFGTGLRRVLESLDLPVLAWDEATATRFDLAVAASENDRLAAFDAPVLLVPHGVGYQKFYPGSRVISGLNPDQLVVGGRVVPAAIALSHPDHLARLRDACPAAADRGAVVGDPSLARMLASRHRADRYRAGFDARDRTLVVLASTWGRESLLGQWPELPERLLAELPVDEYRVAVVAHPGIWAAHGPWQVRAWLARAVDSGLCIVPPHEGWQAALAGASVVVSDHGSLALYAVALGKPLLMAVEGSSTTVPGSALADLSAATTVLDRDRDLRHQVDAAVAVDRAAVRSVVNSSLDCAARLRRLIYGLLRLSEPADEPVFAPVPIPDITPSRTAALVVGAQTTSDGVRVERHPDLGHGAPHDQLHHRHIVADLRYATMAQLAAASILRTDTTDEAEAALSDWPHATMVAVAVDPRACLIRTRSGLVTLRADSVAGLDPLLLASLAYVRLTTSGQVPERDRLLIGARAIPVAAEAG